jgi:hypothetical protein
MASAMHGTREAGSVPPRGRWETAVPIDENAERRQKRSLSRHEERAMSRLFTIGEEIQHVVGDRQCPECPDEYPEPCPCGGLIHAASGEADQEATEWLDTRCDVCGRSEQDLE